MSRKVRIDQGNHQKLGSLLCRKRVPPPTLEEISEGDLNLCTTIEINSYGHSSNLAKRVTALFPERFVVRIQTPYSDKTYAKALSNASGYARVRTLLQKFTKKDGPRVW